MAIAVTTVASGGLPVTDVTATNTMLGLHVAEVAKGLAITKGPGGLAVNFAPVADWPPTGGGGGGSLPPAVLSTTVGWWDASVTASLNLTGAQINSIADQSGGGRTMTAVGTKPTYSATGFNSKPVMLFASGGLATSLLSMGTGNTLTAWYVGTLFNSAAGAADGRTLGYSSPGQPDYGSASWTIYRSNPATQSASFYSKTTGVNTPATIAAYPTPHRFIYTINSSNLLTIYVDGVSVATASIIAGPWNTHGTPGVTRIGTQDGSTGFWNGPIAECGIATGYSDAPTVTQLDTYLKNKWGL